MPSSLNGKRRCEAKYAAIRGSADTRSCSAMTRGCRFSSLAIARGKA